MTKFKVTCCKLVTIDDRPVIDEFVVFRVSGQSLHDVRLGILVGQRDSGNHVSTEINAKNSDGTQWQWNVGNDEDKEWRYFRNVTCQCVCNRLLEIVEDESSYKRTTPSNY